ncbi:hypothetical protein [Bacillus xiapuensis]|uniref:hypothetical protein n=1 Tax=Bacillus xiapuensis TaxID=2014075 RepID=UPI001E3F3B70|nr:hypothetical protein [Bacillus xiapuensis]
MILFALLSAGVCLGSMPFVPFWQSALLSVLFVIVFTYVTEKYIGQNARFTEGIAEEGADEAIGQEIQAADMERGPIQERNSTQMKEPESEERMTVSEPDASAEEPFTFSHREEEMNVIESMWEASQEEQINRTAKQQPADLKQAPQEAGEADAYLEELVGEMKEEQPEEVQASSSKQGNHGSLEERPSDEPEENGEPAADAYLEELFDEIKEEENQPEQAGVEEEPEWELTDLTAAERDDQRDEPEENGEPEADAYLEELFDEIKEEENQPKQAGVEEEPEWELTDLTAAERDDQRDEPEENGEPEADAYLEELFDEIKEEENQPKQAGADEEPEWELTDLTVAEREEPIERDVRRDEPHASGKSPAGVYLEERFDERAEESPGENQKEKATTAECEYINELEEFTAKAPGEDDSAEEPDVWPQPQEERSAEETIVSAGELAVCMDREPSGLQEIPMLDIRWLRMIRKEIEVKKELLSFEQVEEVMKRYLQAPLHDRDYYTLAKGLLSYYIEHQQTEKASELANELKERLARYPVVLSELELIQSVINKKNV